MGYDKASLGLPFSPIHMTYSICSAIALETTMFHKQGCQTRFGSRATYNLIRCQEGQNQYNHNIITRK